MRSFESYKESVADQAAYWLVRLSASDCTPEDRFAFEAWKQEDAAHEAMYIRLQKGNAVVDRHMTDERIQAMLEEARIAVDSAPPIVRSLRNLPRVLPGGLMSLAASIAFLSAVIVSTVVLLGDGTRTQSTEQSRTASAAVEIYETAVGERSTITLADSTNVTINTNSRIEVEYSHTSRLVRLARGQAFFDVRQDVDRPFIVEAGDKRVIALGTAFDVRFDRDDLVQVTLVEGRVKIDNRATPVSTLPGATDTAAKTTSIVLNPGQRLIAKRNLAPEVIATDTMEETSWRNGQLVFRKRLLGSVVDEMNRYSTQRLVLSDDPRIQSLEVSGVFNSGGRASSFVNALEALYPLEAQRSGESELTLVWRE